MNDERRPDDDDEGDVQRPKWVGWLIIVLMVLVSLGVLNVGWRLMRSGAAEPAQAAASPELRRGQALVQASDCARCHLAGRKAVGPGYVEIAARYQGQDDAVAHLARKIREGSVGTWGRVIMPRHPHIAAADADLMARWVMSHAPDVAKIK